MFQVKRLIPFVEKAIHWILHEVKPLSYGSSYGTGIKKPAQEQAF
jgi:hypothetical protein